MTVDPLVYDLAATRLKQSGLTTYSEDFRELAELLQPVIEDFESDLKAKYEKEAAHDVDE